MQLYKIPVLFDCVRRHGRRTRSDERKRVKSPCIGASARAASAKKAKNLHEAEKRRHASTRGARRRGHKGGSASDPRAALCLRKQAGARARKASAPLKPRSGFKSERSELPRPRSGQKRVQASIKSERSELPDREAVKTSKASSPTGEADRRRG